MDDLEQLIDQLLMELDTEVPGSAAHRMWMRQLEGLASTRNGAADPRGPRVVVHEPRPVRDPQPGQVIPLARHRGRRPQVE
jgi:hypothetical protein